MGPAQPLLGQPWSTPNPVAYLPQLGSGLTPNMVSCRHSQGDLAALCTAVSCPNNNLSRGYQWTRAVMTECYNTAK